MLAPSLQQSGVMSAGSVFSKFVLIVATLVVCAQPCLADERDYILRNVEEFEGPVVPRSRARQTYSVLDQLGSRLNRAFNQMHRGGRNIPTEIYLLDSATENAFIQPAHPGRREGEAGQRRNYVFITTSLIARYLPPEARTPQQIRDAIWRIAGILAHEYAHSIDFQDPNGFHRREQGGANGNPRQAMEIRADTEAVPVLRRANMPANSLYQALTGLLSDHTGFDRNASVADRVVSKWGALQATHHETEFRLSANRLAVTFDRVRNGTAEVQPLMMDEAALHREVATLPGVRPAYVDPGSIDATLQRISAEMARPVTKFSNQERNIYLTFLVMSLNERLHRGETMSTTQLNRFAEIMGAIRRARLEIPGVEATHLNTGRVVHDRPEIFSDPALVREIENRAGRTFTGSHQTMVSRLPAYRSPAYLAALNHVATRMDGSDSRYQMQNLGELYRAYADTLPVDQFVRLEPVARFLRAEFAKGNGMRTFSQFQEERLVASMGFTDFPTSLQNAIRAFYYTDVLPGLSEGDNIRNLIAYRGRWLHQGFDLREVREQGHGPAYEAFARRVWENRGWYGIAALLGQGFEIDQRATNTLNFWDNIFNLLNIPREQGFNELRDAMIAFTRTPEYTRLLEQAAPHVRDDFFSTPHWARDNRTLSIALGGDGNASLEASATARPVADRLTSRIGPSAFGRNGFSPSPEEFRDALSARVNRGGLDMAHILDAADEAYRRGSERLLRESTAPGVPRSQRVWAQYVHDRAHPNTTGSPQYFPWALASPPANLLQGIELLPWPSEAKRELLRFLFINPTGTPSRTVFHGSEGRIFTLTPEALAMMIRHGTVTSLGDYLRQRLGTQQHREAADRHQDTVTRFRSTVDGELAHISGLSGRARIAPLERFITDYLDPRRDGQMREHFRLSETLFSELRERAANLLADASPTPQEALRLFNHLTATGANAATDRFFEQHVLPILRANPTQPFVTNAANQQRLRGDRLRLALLDLHLAPQLRLLERNPPTNERLRELVATINTHISHPSLARDEYLESLAWRLNVESLPGLEILERETSAHAWRQIQPRNVQIASAISVHLNELTPEERFALLAFIVDPDHNPMPEAAIDRLSRVPEVGALENRQQERESLREALRLYVQSSSPLERLPAVELLLTRGPNPLIANNRVDPRVMDLLGFAPGSQGRLFLEAYLEVAPVEEQAATVAYLLGTPPDGTTNQVRRIFEAFHAVGIKVGQLMSLFFRDHFGNQLDDLKDHAAPLTKVEIRRILENTLSASQLGRIRRIRSILGSASTRTVALVELTDGREVAVLVQRPGAADHIRGNLARARDYARALARRGIPIDEGVMEAFSHGLEESFGRELMQRQEASRLAEMGRIFDRMNTELAPQMGRWRFRVPQLEHGMGVHDNVLFMQLGPPTSLQRWTELENHPEVGLAIAEATMRMMFRDGVIEPDRHRGNFLVNPETREIYVIDFGQTERFSTRWFFRPGELFNFSQFLRAFGEGSAERLLDYASQLTTTPLTSAQRDRLLPQVRDILSSSRTLEQKMIELTNAFSRNHTPLRNRIAFGAMKTFLVLLREGYLTQEQFLPMLAREAEVAIRAHPVAAAYHESLRTNPGQTFLGFCIQSFSGFGR